MADFGADVDLEAFRGEARAWLAENFPASLRGKAGEAMAVGEGGTPSGELAAWRKRLADKGWTTPTWPTEYGGGGLSVRRRGCCSRRWPRSAPSTRSTASAWASP